MWFNQFKNKIMNNIKNIEPRKIFKDKIANTYLGHLIIYIMALVELVIMNLYHDKKTMSFIKEIIREDYPFLMRPSELFFIYTMAKYQNEIDGDYAEVGVFKGATAKAICEAKKNKSLHLFDTFEGLPEVNKIDTMFKTKSLRSTIEVVQNKLSNYKDVFIYKGFFPRTGASIKDRTFSLVHLDVDIYQSTKDSLNFFYDKMSRGGVIISHDYHALGVKKAFDEFFKGKIEKVIELPMSQCMIVKK